jgi:hypothetical protein
LKKQGYEKSEENTDNNRTSAVQPSMIHAFTLSSLLVEAFRKVETLLLMRSFNRSQRLPRRLVSAAKGLTLFGRGGG